jgi:hypothetical protein
VAHYVYGWIESSKVGNSMVCEMASADGPREEAANAALIAAAPRLLEFLRQWVGLHPTGQLAEETRRLLTRLGDPGDGRR